MKKSDSQSIWFQFGIYSAMGFQLVLSVLGGVYSGQWLEKKFNFAPWGIIIGSMLGLIVGFINLMRIDSWKQKKKS